MFAKIRFEFAKISIKPLRGGGAEAPCGSRAALLRQDSRKVVVVVVVVVVVDGGGGYQFAVHFDRKEK